MSAHILLFPSTPRRRWSVTRNQPTSASLPDADSLWARREAERILASFDLSGFEDGRRRRAYSVDGGLAGSDLIDLELGDAKSIRIDASREVLSRPLQHSAHSDVTAAVAEGNLVCQGRGNAEQVYAGHSLRDEKRFGIWIGHLILRHIGRIKALFGGAAQ